MSGDRSSRSQMFLIFQFITHMSDFTSHVFPGSTDVSHEKQQTFWITLRYIHQSMFDHVSSEDSLVFVCRK